MDLLKCGKRPTTDASGDTVRRCGCRTMEEANIGVDGRPKRKKERKSRHETIIILTNPDPEH